MKKTFAQNCIAFVCCLISYDNIRAQGGPLDCANMCVLDIWMSTEPGMLDVNLLNGSVDINYPIIMVIVDGEVVANVDSTFNFFQHSSGQTMGHTIPTTLDSVPENFECIVHVQDALYDTYCDIAYPCLTENIADPSWDNEVSIFPNPAQNEIMVSSGNIITCIEVYNAVGDKILAVNATVRQHNMVLSAMPAGYYFIRIHTRDAIQTERLVKL